MMERQRLARVAQASMKRSPARSPGDVNTWGNIREMTIVLQRCKPCSPRYCVRRRGTSLAFRRTAMCRVEVQVVWPRTCKFVAGGVKRGVGKQHCEYIPRAAIAVARKDRPKSDSAIVPAAPASGQRLPLARRHQQHRVEFPGRSRAKGRVEFVYAVFVDQTLAASQRRPNSSGPIVHERGHELLFFFSLWPYPIPAASPILIIPIGGG